MHSLYTYTFYHAASIHDVTMKKVMAQLNAERMTHAYPPALMPGGGDTSSPHTFSTVVYPGSVRGAQSCNLAARPALALPTPPISILAHRRGRVATANLDKNGISGHGRARDALRCGEPSYQLRASGSGTHLAASFAWRGCSHRQHHAPRGHLAHRNVLARDRMRRCRSLLTHTARRCAYCLRRLTTYSCSSGGIGTRGALAPTTCLPRSNTPVLPGHARQRGIVAPLWRRRGGRHSALMASVDGAFSFSCRRAGDYTTFYLYLASALR